MSSLKKLPAATNLDRAPVLIALVPICGGSEEFTEYLNEDVKTVSTTQHISLFNTTDIRTVTKMWLDLGNSENLSAELTVTNGKKSLDSRDRKNICSKINHLRNSEMMYLVLYFQKFITFEYFELGLRKVISNEAHAEVVINSAKELVNSSNPFKFTDTVDIRMNENFEGTQRDVRKEAKTLIYSHNGLICCSCMTANQDFLKSLLKYSWGAKRMVRFIRWDHEIPRITFEEIIQRNIAQLFRTGRYYTLSELTLSYCSWTDFYSSATAKTKRLSHSDLAAFLCSVMDSDGFVQPLGQVKKEASGENSSRSASRWSSWSNISTLARLPPALDGQQPDGNVEGRLAARIAFLEARLLQSEEEVLRERQSAESQLAVAKRKEEELNSSSPIHKSRSSIVTGDIVQLQSEVAALKEQKFALQTSLSQAETLSQLVLRLENQVAADRDDTSRLAVTVAELEEHNAAKISELIELKLSVCDLADKVERKKKTLRSLATNAASTRKMKPDNITVYNSAKGGTKGSKLSSKERVSIESPSLDGSRSSKLSNYSSGSGNSDQNPLSLMQNLTLSQLGGQGAQGSLSSIRRIDSGRHIAVRFERSPTIASVESIEY
eukprot:gene24858-33346_t